MADILDINDAVDIDVEDEGEQSVLRLKDKVVKRKGRGFGPGESRDHEKIRGYESIEPGEHGDDVGPQKSVEGWILFVTSVHEEANEDDLVEKFSEFGNIKNISINLDRRTGFLKGYALIEYGTYNEAAAARENLNGTELLGQTISVDWCFVKAPKKGQGYDNGGDIHGKHIEFQKEKHTLNLVTVDAILGIAAFFNILEELNKRSRSKRH